MKYDNNGTGEIYESEGETFIRALLGPNNRFRLAPGALSDMDCRSAHSERVLLHSSCDQLLSQIQHCCSSRVPSLSSFQPIRGSSVSKPISNVLTVLKAKLM